MSTRLGYSLFIHDDATRTIAKTRRYIHAVENYCQNLTAPSFF